MATPVTIGSDLTLPVFTLHMAVFVPPVPAPSFPVYPHMEMVVPINWFVGKGSHELTADIFHLSSKIALDSHDCGMGIIHACLPPNNVLLPIFSIFSKRAVVFSASTVNMNSKPTALAAASFPLQNCADPTSLPVNFAPTAASNTVLVGATAADVAAGLAKIAKHMLLDLIAKALGKALGKLFDLAKAAKKVVSKLIAIAIKKVVKFVKKVTESKTAATKATQSLSSPSASSPAASEAAAVTTSSPFGDATMTFSNGKDGAHSVTTSAPAAAGGTRETVQDGLPTYPPEDQAGGSYAPEYWASALDGAPVL